MARARVHSCRSVAENRFALQRLPVAIRVHKDFFRSLFTPCPQSLKTPAKKPVSKERAFNRLRKNSILRLILGGAAVYRCDNRPLLNAASQFAEKLGFVSGYRFSDTASRSKSIAPLGAGARIPTFSANCSANEVTLSTREVVFQQPVHAARDRQAKSENQPNRRGPRCDLHGAAAQREGWCRRKCSN